MFAHPYWYAVLSRLLAIVLFAAAILKGSDWLRPAPDGGRPWATGAVVAFELSLAIWLFLGVVARWARLAALACFLVFLNVALWAIADGRESCGFLGTKFAVGPWLAVAFDSSAIAGLLLCAPMAVPATSTKIGRKHALGAAGMVVAAALALAYPYWSQMDFRSRNAPGAAPEPVGVDAATLRETIKALERNRAALGTMTFSTEEICTGHPVAAMAKIMVGPEEAKQAYLRGGDLIGRYQSEYAYREDEIRVDRKCLQSPNGAADAPNKHDMLLVGSKGRRVQFFSGLRQAWLTTIKATVDENDGWGVDFRSAGFTPPTKSIADWLREVEILAAGMTRDTHGRPVFQVRALEKRRHTRYVTVRFDPEFNYLPSRLVHRFYPSGGILEVTDIRYSRVQAASVWFPELIRTRCFIRDTNDDEDAPTGQNVTREIKIAKVRIDPRISDEVFDPVLPTRTVVLGDLARAARIGDQPQRASANVRSEPRELIRVVDQRATHLTGEYWLIALAMNGAALTALTVFRRRFALSPFSPMEDHSDVPTT